MSPATDPRPADLIAVSYNIHRCYGADGRCNPERVADVLRALSADIVALQEVDSRLPEHGVDQLAFLAKALGATYIAGPTLMLHRGSYGNGLLVRWPVVSVRRLDLGIRGHEPRGAIDADLDIGGTLVRVVATHLGLARRERKRQAELLLAALASGPRRPSILLGDMNEWLAGTGALGLFNARFGAVASRRTFPARTPLLRLDRLWVDPAAALLDVSVHATRLSRLASDHLPLRARVDVAALAAAGDSSGAGA